LNLEIGVIYNLAQTASRSDCIIITLNLIIIITLIHNYNIVSSFYPTKIFV
jgi:hypothetical protein